jgi:hypothetical protein
VSIESDAEQDLALTAEDAEDVVGGSRKKKTAPLAAHKAPHASGPTMIVMPGGTNPIPADEQLSEDDPDDC